MSNNNQDKPQQGDIRLAYNLPSTIKSLQSGWQASCQGAAVVSALLAGLSGTLLVFVKADGNPASKLTGSGHTLLLLCSYSAVIFNASAIISSLVLIDKLGELPIHSAAAQENDLPQADVFVGSSLKLLEAYKVGSGWRYVMWHWLICLLAGILCIMFQILLLIFLLDSKFLKIAMTVVVVFALLPLLSLIPPCKLRRKDKPSSPA